MNKQDLKSILDNHSLWLNNNLMGKIADLRDANLEGADLRDANLEGANLVRADLRGAYLVRANLRDANLERADLRDANLEGANLVRADLRGAYLVRANLRDANLERANLQGADLQGANLERAYLVRAYLVRADLVRADLRGANLVRADLYGAYLEGAYLEGANLPDFSICPEKGSFIAYKKLNNDVVAEIEIPASAKRTSSLVGRKCRASKVRVVKFLNSKKKKEKSWTTQYIPKTYEVGKTVNEPKYNGDIRVECSEGIHFFMTKKEAENF